MLSSETGGDQWDFQSLSEFHEDVPPKDQISDADGEKQDEISDCEAHFEEPSYSKLGSENTRPEDSYDASDYFAGVDSFVSSEVKSELRLASKKKKPSKRQKTKSNRRSVPIYSSLKGEDTSGDFNLEDDIDSDNDFKEDTIAISSQVSVQDAIKDEPDSDTGDECLTERIPPRFGFSAQLRDFLQSKEQPTQAGSSSCCLDLRIMEKRFEAHLTSCRCEVLQCPEPKTVTAIFDTTASTSLDLQVGHIVRIHPPWHELAEVEGHGTIILCTYNSEMLPQELTSLNDSLCSQNGALGTDSVEQRAYEEEQETDSSGLVETNCIEPKCAGSGPSSNVSVLNTMMSFYRDKGQLDEALEVWDSFQQGGVVPDITSYSIVIEILRAKGDAVNALWQYAQARQQFLGIKSFERFECKKGSWEDEDEPDSDEDREISVEQLDDPEANSYQVGSTDSAQVEASPEIVESIHKLGEVVVHISVEWFYRSLETSEVSRYRMRRHLMQMHQAKLEISQYDCRRLLLKCAEKRYDHIFLFPLYKYMHARRMVTTTFCNYAMRVLSYYKKPTKALMVYWTMGKVGCKPDNESKRIMVPNFRLLFYSAFQKQDWKWSLRLLHLMEHVELTPSVAMFSLVLRTLAKAHRIDETVEVFKKMLACGYEPAAGPYCCLLSALEKHGHVEEMELALDTMVKANVQPNVTMYNTMISAYGKRHDFGKIWKLVTQMQEAGVSFTLVTYNAIITACASAGDADGALYCLEKMKMAGIEPDSITMNKLVEALAAANKCFAAVHAYAEMKEKKMEASPWAYDAVVRVCRKNGVPLYKWIGFRPKVKSRILRSKSHL